MAIPRVSIFPLHGIEPFVMTLADNDDANLGPIAETFGERGLNLRYLVLKDNAVLPLRDS